MYTESSLSCDFDRNFILSDFISYNLVSKRFLVINEIKQNNIVCTYKIFYFI